MILSKLKESTRSQHEALESVVDVMNKTFSREDYRALLMKFYRFYSAMEPRLPADALAVEGFDVGPRLKLPMLVKDLQTLGALDAARELPPLTDLPATETVGQAFGSIYVMEGATLGGQLITRHLKEHLGVTPEDGGAFFNSYGREVGPMWKAFGAAVTAYSEKCPDQDDAIVTAARETFDSFRRCFEQQASADVTI